MARRSLQTAEAKREQTRRRYLARKYGITPEEYEEKLSQQGGRCAVCRRLPGNRRLAVDHNHRTGQLRGLLCYRCNYKIIGPLEGGWPSWRVAKSYRAKALAYLNYWREEYEKTNQPSGT